MQVLFNQAEILSEINLFSDDKTVKLWEVNRQQFKFSLTGHTNWVRSVRLSPDSRLAVSGGDDKVVKLWDLRNKNNIAEFLESAGQINTVRFEATSLKEIKSFASDFIQMEIV